MVGVGLGVGVLALHKKMATWWLKKQKQQKNQKNETRQMV